MARNSIAWKRSPLPKWSYSRQVKTELAASFLPNQGAGWAELAGLMGQSAVLPGALTIRVSSVVVARRAYRLLKTLGLAPKMGANRRNRIQYTLAATVDVGWNQDLTWASSIAAGWFLRHGYITHPDHGPAHLEFWVPRDQDPVILVTVLDALRVKAKTVPKHGGTSVYIKDRAQIRVLLGKMGAHRAMLQWESVDVIRHMKNQVNRLVNSETANLRRAVESGLTQAEYFRRAIDQGRDQAWDEAGQRLARLRIAHPDWSLSELGQAMVPPLSKSAVNHRMRRLLRLAKD
ncbi:MAG: DNA-binding protein WhiA [Firmicutes bacterium]|nr:DNA-binding protein WhiA [Bacillota bacterium]